MSTTDDTQQTNDTFDQSREDFLFIVSTEAGRRFLWGQLSYCGVFRSSFSEITNWTNFNEGRRDAGLQILAKFNDYAPEAYSLMTKENAN